MIIIRVRRSRFNLLLLTRICNTKRSEDLVVKQLNPKLNPANDSGPLRWKLKYSSFLAIVKLGRRRHNTRGLGGVGGLSGLSNQPSQPSHNVFGTRPRATSSRQNIFYKTCVAVFRLLRERWPWWWCTGPALKRKMHCKSPLLMCTVQSTDPGPWSSDIGKYMCAVNWPWFLCTGKTVQDSTCSSGSAFCNNSKNIIFLCISYIGPKVSRTCSWAVFQYLLARCQKISFLFPWICCWCRTPIIRQSDLRIVETDLAFVIFEEERGVVPEARMDQSKIQSICRNSYCDSDQWEWQLY